VARWSDTYEAFARDQYADHLAWTLLLVDDDDGARALLDESLAHVLSRSHGAHEPDQLIPTLRARIVRSFLASPPPASRPASEGTAAPARQPDVAAPEPDLSVYAPPPAASAPSAPTPPLDEGTAAPATASSPRPEAVRGRVSVREALAGLHPRARALVVLHHHDGLSVADAGRMTGLTAEEAAALLRAGGGELARRTGVAVPPIADAAQGGGSQVSVAIEEWA